MDVADRLDRLESSVKKLAADVGEVRGELRVIHRRIDGLSEAMDEGNKQLGEHGRILAALHQAATSLIRQTSTDKAVEARLRRLEAAVFGAKH